MRYLFWFVFFKIYVLVVRTPNPNMCVGEREIVVSAVSKWDPRVPALIEEGPRQTFRECVWGGAPRRFAEETTRSLLGVAEFPASSSSRLLDEFETCDGRLRAVATEPRLASGGTLTAQ